MQQVSDLYLDIISGEYQILYRLRIYNKNNSVLYYESDIYSMEIHLDLFERNTPMIGCAVAGEIDVVMKMPSMEIPRMAKIIPYAAVTNGTLTSEYYRQGVYFIDTRDVTHNDDGTDILTIHGFDAMLKAEAMYESDNASNYPTSIKNIATKIANDMGVSLDSRTVDLLQSEPFSQYRMGLPVSYSMREVLRYIGSMCAGNWIMSDYGDLRLIQLNAIGEETNLLVDSAGFAVVFGNGNNATRILV